MLSRDVWVYIDRYKYTVIQDLLHCLELMYAPIQTFTVVTVNLGISMPSVQKSK